jgi:2-polyprenyl-3-methyl-5-hydroxy-6-metoxy-1,4-benzoquinol methylase
MTDQEHAVARHPEFGYRHLDPIPGDEELRRFYRDDYYRLIHEKKRAPELRRLTAGGAAAETERDWLRQSLYADLVEILRRHAPGRRVLDVGCGVGDLMAHLEEQGFAAEGIEPSVEAAELARAQKLRVCCKTIEEYASTHRAERWEPFDGITLINVLEHVPHPVEVVETCRGMLGSAGVLVVRVPNDFTEMQAAAHAKLGGPRWWVAAPDHINYFDFESLGGLLERMGFEVVHRQSDFPMELFLLMGENYVGDSDVGGRCHEKRVRFETALPTELRRRMYEALAGVGVGRSCLVCGRLRS